MAGLPWWELPNALQAAPVGGLGSGVLESWGLVAAVDLVGQLFLRISHWPLGSELKGRVQGTLHGVFHM